MSGSGLAPSLESGTALLKLIRFSHTLFARPYAIVGALLGAAAHGGLSNVPWISLVLVVVCMVAARTAAMTFNRLVDRKFDASNPRTRGRPSVTGEVPVRTMVFLIAVSTVVFVAASISLNPLCGKLSLIALTVILGYSYMKRVSALCHLVLGGALGLAPIGAYLAVGGAWDGGTLGIIALGAAVMAWTAGFDVIYSCQDVEHDRSLGLHSIPANWGISRALVFARVFHALVPLLLTMAALLLDLGAVFHFGTFVVALLLIHEHRLVKPDDLSQVDRAFFNVNILISAVVLVTSLADLAFEGRL